MGAIRIAVASPRMLNLELDEENGLERSLALKLRNFGKGIPDEETLKGWKMDRKILERSLRTLKKKDVKAPGVVARMEVLVKERWSGIVALDEKHQNEREKGLLRV